MSMGIKVIYYCNTKVVRGVSWIISKVPVMTDQLPVIRRVVLVVMHVMPHSCRDHPVGNFSHQGTQRWEPATTEPLQLHKENTLPLLTDRNHGPSNKLCNFKPWEKEI